MHQFNIPDTAARCVVMVSNAAEINLHHIVGGLIKKFGSNPKVICGSGKIKIDRAEHPLDVSDILDAGSTNSQNRVKAKMLMRSMSYGKMLTIAYGDKKIIDKAIGKALGKVVMKTNPSRFRLGIAADEIGVIYLDRTDKVVKVEKQSIRTFV